MRITYRIPTEMYAYVEIESEMGVNDDPTKIAETYNYYADAFKQKSGISDKDFDAFIENQVSGKSNQLETYTQMSDEQKKYVQIIKRAIKRATAKIAE